MKKQNTHSSFSFDIWSNLFCQHLEVANTRPWKLPFFVSVCLWHKQGRENCLFYVYLSVCDINKNVKINICRVWQSVSVTCTRTEELPFFVSDSLWHELGCENCHFVVSDSLCLWHEQKRHHCVALVANSLCLLYEQGRHECVALAANSLCLLYEQGRHECVALTASSLCLWHEQGRHECVALAASTSWLHPEFNLERGNLPTLY